MDLTCKKCLSSRTGDVLGQPCRTSGCDGVIEEQPAFKTLVDELPEPMTCGRRAEMGMDQEGSPFRGAFKSGRGLDRWEKFKSNGNRVCSYCGSLHPDDLFELVRQSANAPEDAARGTVVDIEPSDKGYKIYVQQPGVRNAHEGGIKFYTQHLPRDTEGKLLVTDAQNAEYAKAVRGSQARFERYMSARMNERAKAVRCESAQA